MAETRKTLFSTTPGGTVKDSDVMAYKETGAAGDPTRNHLFSVMKTFFQGLLPARIAQNESDISTLETETDLNTVYKDRVKTKVLWTGPLSVVSTPTSLDGGEKFSDWDEIEIHTNLFDDSNTFVKTVQKVQTSFLTKIQFYSDLGSLQLEKLSDTSFQIGAKTVGAGNIQRIIGISL